MRNLFPFVRFTIRRLRFRLGARPIKSSHPFLSGDTYRLSCEIDASSHDGLSELSIGNESVFTTPGQLQALLDYLIFHGLALPKTSLVIHNGDESPDLATMDLLSTKFMRIYSTNWLESHPKIEPIPIGLENIRYLRNGIPSDFSRLRMRSGIDRKHRPIDLLVAFSLHTNPIERRAALSAARSVPGVKVVQNFMSSYKYLELVSQSKFVLSPPGNGPDCHRTWESIYLGAVPIVLESAWPFKDFDLPVAQVSNWDEISSVVKGSKVFEFPSPEQIHDLFTPKFGVEI